MKQATTVEQQINILKTRGMLIDLPEEKVKENTKFSNAVNLYYLDTDLRKMLANALNRIELNFRTNIIYTVSNQYVNCNTWFIDPAVMEKAFIDKFETEFYTENFKKNPIIKNHHKKYINDKYAPAWKTLEFFTFGTMVNLYKSLKDKSLKQKIAIRYGIRNEKVLENYFSTLVEMRNICAHNSVLFDHKLYKELKNGPAFNVSNRNGYQVFPAIKVIWFILNSISQNRASELKNNIISLFDKYKNDSVISCVIENCIGYKNIF